MPEGDRDFHWLNQIKEIRDQVEVPIIIKEVGFGLDQATIHTLKMKEFSILTLPVAAALILPKSKMPGIQMMSPTSKISAYQLWSQL